MHIYTYEMDFNLDGRGHVVVVYAVWHQGLRLIHTALLRGGEHVVAMVWITAQRRGHITLTVRNTVHC